MNDIKELRRIREQARKQIPLNQLPVEYVNTMKKYKAKKRGKQS